jgi:hypothetical protein
MRERGGRTVAMPIPNTSKETIQGVITQMVETGSMLNTDEAGAYDGIKALSFGHETINHSAGEYVRDDVTTNGRFFAIRKMDCLFLSIYTRSPMNH